jgi:hypothetical protein
MLSRRGEQENSTLQLHSLGKGDFFSARTMSGEQQRAASTTQTPVGFIEKKKLFDCDRSFVVVAQRFQSAAWLARAHSTRCARGALQRQQ